MANQIIKLKKNAITEHLMDPMKPHTLCGRAVTNQAVYRRTETQLCPVCRSIESAQDLREAEEAAK